MYKLSPSDFAYLYQDCKRCYCLKIKHNIYQPSMPMPGIFGAINTRLQGALVGTDLRTLAPHLPEGKVVNQEGFVESKPVPGTKIYLKGKYDLLVKRPDGTYVLVDFKLSQPHEDKIEKYKTQLFAYKYMLEHPIRGKAVPVTQMGLIIMYPDKVKFIMGEAQLTFPPNWLEIPMDESGFIKFIQEVDELLAGPLPPETPTCKWCQYRHVNERFDQRPIQEDLPF